MDDKMISKAMAYIGSRGGTATAKNLGAAGLSERGRKAVAERWRKYRELKSLIALGENTKGRVELSDKSERV